MFHDTLKFIDQFDVFIFFNLLGPPYFTSAVRNFQTDDDHDIKFNLSLISFPHPSALVELKNDAGITLSKSYVTFETELVSFQAYGVKIEAPGYSTVVEFSKTVRKWMSTIYLSLLVSNDIGTTSHTFDRKGTDNSGLGLFM